MNVVATRQEAGGRPIAVQMRALPWFRIAVILIVATSAALTVAWIAVDRTPPAWDQSRYLMDALDYVRGLHRAGVGGVINAFFSADPYYAPGYAAFLFPFELFLGPSVQSALIANLVLWVGLLVTVTAIARQVFGDKAALITCALTATIPELLFFLHQALIDIPAATCACLAVLVMLRTAQFTRSITCALLGAIVGIGLLTKATVLVFLAGPILVVGLRAVLRLTAASRAKRLRVGANMLLATAVAASVAGPWYVTNWDTTIAYLQSSTSGEGSRGMGPDNPLDPAALAAFATTIVNAASFVLVAGIAVLSLVLLLNRTRPDGGESRVSRNSARRRWTWALLTSWALVPLVVFGTSHNQDPRQAMFVFPCLAIVFAGLSVVTRPRVLSFAVTATVLAVCVSQALVAQLPPLDPIRDAAHFNVAFGSNSVAVFQPAFGVANPSGDDGTPVLRQLESLAGKQPARVLVAEEDHVFNPNTLSWLGQARQDQFTFEDPQGLTGDPAELGAYDLAVYMPATQVEQRNQEPRLLILNQGTATTVFANQLFTIFSRSQRRIALGDGTIVWVLQR